MSASVSGLSALDNTLLQELTADLSSTASTASTASTTTASSTTDSTTDTAGSSSENQLTKDLATLLQDLFAGNVSGSKSDLTKVQKDLQSENSASGTSTSSADAASSTDATDQSPLEKLLSSISTSLSSGNTTGALSDLASFLIQNGQGTGNLVNTTA